MLANREHHVLFNLKRQSYYLRRRLASEGIVSLTLRCHAVGVCLPSRLHHGSTACRIRAAAKVMRCIQCSLVPLPSLGKASGGGIVSLGVRLSRCVYVRWINLDGEDNALYPMFSHIYFSLNSVKRKGLQELIEVKMYRADTGCLSS